jgi:hypothetical protein
MSPATHFTYQKITSTTTKNQQIAQNKEEKYALIHFPQNLQRRNDIYANPNYPSTQTDYLHK